MGVPLGTRRVLLVGLGLLAAGLLVVAMVSSERALGVDASAPMVLVAGALVIAVAAGHVVSSGAAAPRGLRTIAWGVPVLPTLALGVAPTGFLAPLALAGFKPSAVFLLLTMLWSPVLILWIVFGIAVVVSRPRTSSPVRPPIARVGE